VRRGDTARALAATRLGIPSRTEPSPRGTVLAAVACPAGISRCSGTLALVAPRHGRLGAARFAVPGGRTVHVAVRLSGPARRLLAHRGQLRVDLVGTVRDAAGHVVRRQRSFTLRARRRAHR
jgi:hypothetical protein